MLVPIKGVGSVTTLALIGAGSRYENKINNGVSHFLEHMAFKGTNKRPSAREIATLIDGIGAESNAFTGKETTGYYIKSASEHIDLALDVLSDILSDSKFDPVEIDRERGVILEEINLYEDTPARKIGDIFERLLYDDTPMGWDISGEKDVIKNLTRQDFVSYMNKLYSATNMVVVIAGDITLESGIKKVEKYFSKMPGFKTEEFSRLTETQIKPEISIKYKETEQAHFGLGVRTVGLLNEEDKHPLTVLASILGGGMSSRLFYEIRERRGLAYYVRAFSENYIDRGYLAAFAGVDPKRIDDAIKIVVEEFEKIKNKGEIKKEELDKAKEYLTGHFVLDLEDTRSVAVFYGASELLENKPENPDEIIKRINQVTLDDIHRVANKYLDTKGYNLALIGNFKDEDHFKKFVE
ncbi:MAG: insulinase family protein [Actinobacteria bacterium]|nr:insulinase family protein [Actinomycetota bacterium]